MTSYLIWCYSGYKVWEDGPRQNPKTFVSELKKRLILLKQGMSERKLPDSTLFAPSYVHLIVPCHNSVVNQYNVSYLQLNIKVNDKSRQWTPIAWSIISFRNRLWIGSIWPETRISTDTLMFVPPFSATWKSNEDIGPWELLSQDKKWTVNANDTLWSDIFHIQNCQNGWMYEDEEISNKLCRSHVTKWKWWIKILIYRKWWLMNRKRLLLFDNEFNGKTERRKWNNNVISQRSNIFHQHSSLSPPFSIIYFFYLFPSISSSFFLFSSFYILIFLNTLPSHRPFLSTIFLSCGFLLRHLRTCHNSHLSIWSSTLNSIRSVFRNSVDQKG
jgi:hypothetical protein